MTDMTIILGGQVIPKPTGFKRIIERNETDRRTLGGSLHTDFISRLRSWELTWDAIKVEDYDTINTLFENQYVNQTYYAFQFDAYSIYTTAKIEVKEDQNIKYNNSIIENFSIILKEQYAIS